MFLITSDQCPYTWKAMTEISEVAEREFKMQARMVRLETSSEAQQVPFAFGTFGIVYNGKVVADHPVSKTRFKNIMRKECS